MSNFFLVLRAVLAQVLSYFSCFLKLYVNACIAHGGWVPRNLGAGAADPNPVATDSRPDRLLSRYPVKYCWESVEKDPLRVCLNQETVNKKRQVLSKKLQQKRPAVSGLNTSLKVSLIKSHTVMKSKIMVFSV